MESRPDPSPSMIKTKTIRKKIVPKPNPPPSSNVVAIEPIEPIESSPAIPVLALAPEGVVLRKIIKKKIHIIPS
jgi:hypothetical protein